MSRGSGLLRVARNAPRALASGLLLLLGVLLLLASQLAIWTDDAVFDSDGFTSRAVRAVEDDGVQAYASSLLLDRLLDSASPALAAARPLIGAAVQAVLDSAAFIQLYENLLRDAHRALLDGSRIVLQAADVLEQVRSTLAGFSPDLADSLGTDSWVVQIEESQWFSTARSVLEGVQTVADTIGVLSWLLPLLTVAAFAGSWAFARGRRSALVRIGVAVAIAAVLMVVLLDVGRAAAAAIAGGDRAAAARGGWNAFLGDLRAWNVALGVGGAALATAASPWIGGLGGLAPSRVPGGLPGSPAPGQALARLWALATAPRSGGGRLLRAAVVVAAGGLALRSPGAFVQIAIVAAALAAVYLGAMELLRLLRAEAEAGDGADGAPAASGDPPSPLVRAAAGGLLAAAILLAARALLSSLGL